MQHDVAVGHLIGHPAHRRRAAKDHVSAGRDAVRRNRQRLFAHPLRRKADGGNLVDVITQAAFFDHLRQHGQDARVIHARPHVQHGRDTDRLADFAQARPDFGQTRFTEQQTELGGGNRAAAGLDDQHILLEQFAW